MVYSNAQKVGSLPRSSHSHRAAYRLLGLASTVLLGLFGSTIAEAQTTSYTVRKIADSTQLAGVAAASCVGVNSLSTVVFTTIDGSVWIGRGNGAALQLVTSPNSSGQPLAAPCAGLNDRDDVVYGFSFASPAYTALVKSSAGVLTQLARSNTAPFLNETSDTAVHSLTNAGASFIKALDGRLYVMPSGTPLYPQGPTDSLLSSVLAGTLNENGVAAFYAVRQVGGAPKAGIYRSSAIPLVEDGNAVVDFVSVAHPVINNTGVVAFLGSLHDGRDHLLTTSDGVNFVDRSVNIGTSLSPGFAINDVGGVVFAAKLPGNTGFGIFTGPDAVGNRVIAPGDSLDGSTLVTASVWQESLNANGQISFLAQLADGRSGIYRADPNSMPSAANGSLSAVANTTAAGTLVASDPAGLPLTFAIQSNGTKGTATITNPATGAYVYTPNLNAIGADAFTFWVSERHAVSRCRHYPLCTHQVRPRLGTTHLSQCLGVPTGCRPVRCEQRRAPAHDEPAAHRRLHDDGLVQDRGRRPHILVVPRPRYTDVEQCLRPDDVLRQRLAAVHGLDRVLVRVGSKPGPQHLVSHGADRGGSRTWPGEGISQRHAGVHARRQSGHHVITVLDRQRRTRRVAGRQRGGRQGLRCRPHAGRNRNRNAPGGAGSHGRPQRLVSPGQRGDGHE